MKKDRSPTIIVIAMLSTAALLCSVIRLSGTSLDQEMTEGLTKFIVINNASGAFFIPAMVTWILCLAGCIGCFCLKAEKKWFAVLPTLMVLIAPLYLGKSFVDEAAGLHDVATLKVDLDHEYHLLMSHFLQGSELVLAKFESRSGSNTRYRQLAMSPWETSFGYLAIVRPSTLASQKSTEDGHLLTISKDQILLDAGGSSIFLAYDLKNEIAYGQLPDQNKEHHVRELSPFLLVGPNDTLNADDAKEIMKDNQFSFPDLNPVEPELNNPNPAVRKLAQQLVARIRKEPKKT